MSVGDSGASHEDAPASGQGTVVLPGHPLLDEREERTLPFRVRWLGRVGYQAALELQEEIVREHRRFGDLLLLLEHEPVYTTGRGGRAENLGAAGASGAAPLVRIGRGGDVTYHGPGQLVGYPLLNLRTRGGDVHRFLRDLESGVIATLSALGVAATRWPGKTGVWVADPDVATDEMSEQDMIQGRVRKIASIGIGVRRGISMHGFALNVALDLAPFAAIVPCGLGGVHMTSVAHERGTAPDVASVAALAARALAAAIGPRPAATTAYAGLAVPS